MTDDARSRRETPRGVAARDAQPRRGHQRPGGRTERVRQAVAQAVLDMLKDGNVHFSIGAVAERTGVHRSTLYKRWRTRADLMREALTLHNRRLEIPNTGSWSEDVRALAHALAAFAWDPAEIGMNAAVAANTDAAFTKSMFKAWMPVQRQLRRPVERAIARGELPEDSIPDLVLTMLYAPIIVRTVFEKKPADPTFVNALAETLIRVAKPAPAAQRQRR